MTHSVAVPHPRSTACDLIDVTIRLHARRTALIDGPSGASATYDQLGDRVTALAGWLHDEGLGTGSVVATWAPNVPPVAAFTLAAMKVGAMVTGINPVAPDLEVGRHLADAKVAAMLTVPHLADRANRLGVRRIIVVGDAPCGTSLTDVLGHQREAPPAAVDPEAVALLPYSSGTTGVPKGVMLSHDNLTAVTAQLLDRIRVDEHDVTLAVAPFFHILGMTATLLVPLAAGATVVTMPRFEPIEFLELVQRHHVSYLAVPPPVASFLATHPAVDTHDLSSLEFLACGGAPLPASVQKRLAERLPGCAVGQGWGLTETSGAVSIPDRRVGAAPGTVGRPLGQTQVRVVDPDTGIVLDSGATGELEVRGPQIMRGYLDRPADTETMLRPDGWLRTGDLGHIDADGNVVIVDRIKDLIKVKGLQVSPTEVEQVLMSHPGVADAAVASRPDERAGEVPVAFVVPKSDVSVEELHAWLVDRLSSYKCPAAIHMADRLPRTPSGKLLRRPLDSA